MSLTEGIILRGFFFGGGAINFDASDFECASSCNSNLEHEISPHEIDDKLRAPIDQRNMRRLVESTTGYKNQICRVSFGKSGKKQNDQCLGLSTGQLELPLVVNPYPTKKVKTSLTCSSVEKRPNGTINHARRSPRNL